MPLRERFAAFRADNTVASPTGKKADKAFFDDLSGEPLMLFADASALIAMIAGEATRTPSRT